jgi:hypothetical protein
MADLFLPMQCLVASSSFLARWKVREGESVKYRISERRVTFDEWTMKEASTVMLTRDQASFFMHQKNPVALDLRNQGWLNFR